MSGPHYTLSFKTVSTGGATTPADITSLYFYDTGTTENGLPVYYDTSGTYAKWSTDATHHLITLVADVGGTPGGYFNNTSPSDTWNGFAPWSGTFDTSTVLISDAWYRAESTVFESLRTFVGGDEGNNCFRGFLPGQGDREDLKFVNVWQVTSGGSDNFDTSRIIGNDPTWCSMRADGRIESVWKTREEAMQFAGMVEAWLVSNNNLSETGNVTWCSLSDIPGEPETYLTAGANRKRYWKQIIDLDIVYATEGVYA